MTNNMNIYKQINWKVMIPVMLFVIFQSAFNSFSSVLANISQVFPEVSATSIQMILTIPSLMTIPISLCAGILASYFYKKHLVLFALACQLLGGLFPILFHQSFYFIIISSALIGVGQGFMISIASSVIGENFTGVTSGAAMGLKQAASSVGIAALTVATGFLALSTWYHAYYIYFLIIPIFILTVFLLPKGQKDVKIVGNGMEGIKKVFTRGCIYYSVLSFFMAACNFAFYTNIGMSIINRGLGDASAIGVSTAWNSLITIVIGILFGYICKAFKRFTLASSLIIQCIAYFILVMSPSLSIIAIGGMIYGLGAGIQMVSACYYILESVEKDAGSLAIAVCMTLTSLGISASPLIINNIAPIFGEINGTTGLQVAAFGFIILFVIEVLYSMMFNKDSGIGK